MATFTPQMTSVLGTVVTMNTCNGGGDSFPVTGVVGLIVRNADASSHTVTVVRPGTTYGTADPDITVTVAAGATAFIGPIPAEFADPSDGLVDVTYSAVTSQTMGVVRML